VVIVFFAGAAEAGATPLCALPSAAARHMYKLRVGQRVCVRAPSVWTCVDAALVGRSGTIKAFTAGGFDASNECYDVQLDGNGLRRVCLCFHDVRLLTGG